MQSAEAADMSSIPLYVAATVCFFLGIFVGSMAYLDPSPSTSSPPNYGSAGVWMAFCLAFLMLAAFLP